MRQIAIFGSTGSIGRQALEVLSALGAGFRVSCLAAHRSTEVLAEQVRTWNPDLVVVGDPRALPALLERLPAGDRPRVLAGPDGLVEAAEAPGHDVVLAAMSGFAGLPVALAALRAGHRLALANKESLVAAGPLLRRASEAGRAPIIPVDSEHSALFQCLLAGRREEIARLTLTGSGGPFRTRSLESLRDATPEEAARHPTWTMGRKISIDSATMMNKALEIVEACELFGLGPEHVDVVVHPQSIVHSLVTWRDGSVMAQMSVPDMRLPIRYALTWPQRAQAEGPGFSPELFSGLSFEPVDHARFPSIGLGYEAAARGGSTGAVLNAANEAAVDLFLRGSIRFPEITDLVGEVLARHRTVPIDGLEVVEHCDQWARDEVTACLRT
jgi:1-deoxy-D-xylulose-5-phosphate reductoisomerase